MLTTRLADAADAEIVGFLVHALDTHYRGAEARPASEAAAMARRTLETGEGTRFLLAFDDTQPVGIACFAVVRPGRALKGVIFLKDLFTVPAARNRGVGHVIMQALARYADAHGIGRIDLTTDPSNDGAQRLYELLGGERHDKILYRFDGDRLSALAAAKPQS